MIDGEVLGDVLGVVEIEVEGLIEVEGSEEGCGLRHNRNSHISSVLLMVNGTESNGHLVWAQEPQTRR